MSDRRIRALQVHDAASVADLLSVSFEPGVLPYLPYCQPGMPTYLRVLIDWPQHFPGRRLDVAVGSEDEVLGFAEWRCTGGTSVLSYICIAPSARGQGLGRRLIAHHLAHETGCRVVELDVFAHNAPAVTLYEGLGFQRMTTSTWWQRELPEADDETEHGLTFLDWPAVIACYRSYGFCQVDAVHRGDPIRFGLPSREAARLSDARSFSDEALLAGIRAHLPELRRGLLVLPADAAPPVDGTWLLDSHRLSAEASLLRRDLG